MGSHGDFMVVSLVFGIAGAGEFCVLCAVREQIEHSLGYSGKVVSPSNLVDNMSRILMIMIDSSS